MIHARWPARLLASAALLIVSACSIIRVEVAAPAPGLSSSGTPIPPLSIQSASSASLVASDIADDSNVLVRTVALPHLVYAPDRVSIEVFGQWAMPVDYLVIQPEHGLRFRVQWNALWLAESYGRGRIEMDIYLQMPDSADFQLVESAWTLDFEGWGADQRQELLDATLYLSEIGRYGVRAELRIEAVTEAGEVVTATYDYETQIVTLNQPARLLVSPEDFRPQFGNLEQQAVLIDWRGWRLGPCLIRTDELVALAGDIANACVAFANGDWDAAIEALLTAIANAEEEAAVLARLHQQAGTLLAASGDWEQALAILEAGLIAALRLNDSLEIAIALRNLGVVQYQLGQPELSELSLWQSIQISDQIEDWFGSALAYGQLGYYWQSIETLDWVITVMRDHGLTQAEILQQWRDAFAVAAE